MSSNSQSTELPYVVLEIADDVRANTRPFKTALHVPDAKNKQKTQHNTWFYCFSADTDGKVYFKVGQTYNEKTYGSQNRYCPWVEYRGKFQILHYGHTIELLVRHYLKQITGSPLKGTTEWFANARTAIKTLLRAIEVNDEFKADTPKSMVYVAPFEHAFTCGYSAKLDKYLTLFRLRYRGKLYRLCEENIDQSLAKIATPIYQEATPATSSLAASVADGGQIDDDESEDSEDSEDSEEDSDDSEEIDEYDYREDSSSE